MSGGGGMLCIRPPNGVLNESGNDSCDDPEGDDAVGAVRQGTSSARWVDGRAGLG